MANVARAIERDPRPVIAVRRPLAGLTVARFTGERPLVSAIPEHYGTTMHLSGKSRWASGGAEWSSAPGSVSVKVPGQVAVEQAREGALDFQVVLFDLAQVEEARRVLDRPFVLSHMLAIDPRDPRTASLAALHRHLLDDAPAETLENAACEALHALVDIVSSPHSVGPDANTQRKSSAAVVRARAYLDARFTEAVCLEALAAHARLDKFRLCRAFREEIGLPPHAYVTHRRVARAQALLARGMPQAEVAASVGFYDQSLLHRHFKRILRVTPGAYVRTNDRLTASTSESGDGPRRETKIGSKKAEGPRIVGARA